MVMLRWGKTRPVMVLAEAVRGSRNKGWPRRDDKDDEVMRVTDRKPGQQSTSGPQPVFGSHFIRLFRLWCKTINQQHLVLNFQTLAHAILWLRHRFGVLVVCRGGIIRYGCKAMDQVQKHVNWKQQGERIIFWCIWGKKLWSKPFIDLIWSYFDLILSKFDQKQFKFNFF
jgi:hypothetical protein